MKKILQRLAMTTLAFILSFSLTGVVSAAAPAFPWKTDWSQTTYFPNSQGGSVKARSGIRVTAVKGPMYKLTYNIRLENLPTAEGETEAYVYQAWLIDRETGWRISIGSTIRKSNGMGEMGFTQYFANPKVFDKLEVTQEKIFDQNPAPENRIVYSTDLNIPAFTELGYKATFSPKNLVPPGPTSNKGGSGKFTINVRNNTIKYLLNIKNIPAEGRIITLHGPARPGAEGPEIQQLQINADNMGEMQYSAIDEEKLMNGEYYIVVGSEEQPDGFIRGQIIY